MVLGSLASDFTLFPICVRSWKQMTDYRQREYNRQIKFFFTFRMIHKNPKRQVILTKLGKIWRDTQGNLFDKFYSIARKKLTKITGKLSSSIVWKKTHWR